MQFYQMIFLGACSLLAGDFNEETIDSDRIKHAIERAMQIYSVVVAKKL